MKHIFGNEIQISAEMTPAQLAMTREALCQDAFYVMKRQKASLSNVRFTMSWKAEVEDESP